MSERDTRESGRPQIAALGHALLDMEYLAEEALVNELGMLRNDTVLAESQVQEERLARLGSPIKSACGGSTVNAVSTAVGLGVSAHISCRLGDDAAGHRYQEDLTQRGILHQAAMDADNPTGTALVIATSAHERSMSTCLAASGGLSLQDVNVSVVEAADWLLTEGYLLTDSSPREALLLAQSHAQKTVFCLSAASLVTAFYDFFEEVINKGVHILVGNRDEATAWTGIDSPQAAADKMKRQTDLVVVTDGEHGAWLAENSAPSVHISPTKVHAIDPLGAGDAFAGGLVAALAQGCNPGQAVEKACHIGAEATTFRGPRIKAERLARLAMDFGWG